MADRNAQIIVGLRNQASPEILKIAGDYRAFLNQLQAGGATIAQAERQMLSLAQARARAFAAAGQETRGEQELTAALGLATTESRTLYSAQTQLANVQKKVAGETGGLKQALGGLTQAFGALGVGFGVQQLVAFGKSAAEDALKLRETKNSLRAVTGDAQTYAQVLSEARRAQLLFGGSLQENIEGLQGLAITARQSGASLTTLIDLQKRLAVLDPSQGAGGARIALSEALSGDPISLAKRYEIPRAALQKLRDTTLPVEERLKVIDDFLAKVGITSAAVAGKVDQDALAFRRLGQELGDLRNTGGDNLATMFSGAATGLGRLLGLINGNPQAIAELKALFGRSGSSAGGNVVDQEALDKATRQLAASRASDLLGGARGQPIVSERLGGTENLHIAQERMTALIAVGGEAQAAVERLAAAFRDGSISGDTYNRALEVLYQREIQNVDVEAQRVERLASLSQATQSAASEIQTFIAGLQKSAEASILDAAKKDAQQAATALLAQKTTDAASAFLALNPNIDAAGVAALIAAGKLSPLIGQLIVARQEAEKAGAALRQLVNGGPRGTVEDRLERDTPQDRAEARAAGLELVRNQAAAAETARRNQIVQTGTATQIVTLRQKEYNEAVAKFGKGSAQAIDAQTRLIESQERQKAELEKGGRGRVSAAQSTALQLANVEQNSGLQLARIQRENLERLRDQEEDFAVKRARSTEDFDRNRRRLFAEGRRAEAARLTDDFNRQQRRDQEDFDRQRRRTLRNNAEQLGDTTDRADLRTQQIQDRAALRGVRPGTAAASVPIVPVPGGERGGAGAGSPGGVLALTIQLQPTAVQIDGQTIVNIIWPEIHERVDVALSNELNITIPGSGQIAVAGVRP